MAELRLTPQQQRFVFTLLQGGSQVEAYRAAGYPSDKKTAHQLEVAAKQVAVGTRVRRALARARDDAAERAQITVDTLVEQLLETREIALACDPPQANAAVSATMGVGKLLGLVVDRAQIEHVSKPSLQPAKELELTREEWERQFGPKAPQAQITHNER